MSKTRRNQNKLKKASKRKVPRKNRRTRRNSVNRSERYRFPNSNDPRLKKMVEQMVSVTRRKARAANRMSNAAISRRLTSNQRAALEAAAFAGNLTSLGRSMRRGVSAKNAAMRVPKTAVSTRSRRAAIPAAARRAAEEFAAARPYNDRMNRLAAQFALTSLGPRNAVAHPAAAEAAKMTAKGRRVGVPGFHDEEVNALADLLEGSRLRGGVRKNTRGCAMRRR